MRLRAVAHFVFSSALAGFGLLGTIATIAILLAGNVIGPILALLWALVTHTPWRRLGFRRPESVISTLATGILCGIILKLLLKAVVMPLLGFTAINTAYQFLVGNRAALPGMLTAVILEAGLGEEIVWRGFLFERFHTLMPAVRLRRAAALLTSALLFGLAHLHDQGLAGATQAVMTGLVFGGLFIVAGQLWLPIVAHAAFDVTAVLLIYWNLESSVGHAIFR